MSECIKLESMIKDSLKKKCEEAYEKGLVDAWNLACKIGGTYSGSYEGKTLAEIFQSSSTASIFNTYTYSEALAAVEAYEKEQSTFMVGDVVIGDDDLDELGVITWAAGDDVYVMWSDGSCGQERFIESLHKTGKHIDVPEFLQKIGGVE